MIRSLVLFILVPIAVACSSCQPQTPPVIGPEPAPAPEPSQYGVDAGPEPTIDASRLDACDRMCRHRRAIRCPDGLPTAAGTSCEVVCRTNRDEPAARLTAAYLACLTKTPTCDEASCKR